MYRATSRSLPGRGPSIAPLGHIVRAAAYQQDLSIGHLGALRIATARDCDARQEMSIHHRQQDALTKPAAGTFGAVYPGGAMVNPNRVPTELSR